MKQIYTKTGDAGDTSLRNGVRVAKDDLRIEVNGQLDHLNAILGVIRSMWDTHDEAYLLIASVQNELMTIMSHVATPEGAVNLRQLHTDELTQHMEQFIDSVRKEGGFVVPGSGSQLSAFLHLGRTQTRTVERRLWTLHRQYPVHESILRMMNRLSDYLFVLTIDKE